MNNPWLLCGIGMLFCCSGAYMFFKNIFEEGKPIKWPILVMLAGILLIGAGTAKYFKLM